MSLTSENIIPGNHGKVFTTDINSEVVFKKVEEELLKIKGVEDVLFNDDRFPHEVTVHTNSLIKVNELQTVVKNLGYHIIPRTLFIL